MQNTRAGKVKTLLGSLALLASTPASAAPMMTVMGATSAPIGFVEFCARTPAECQGRTAQPTVVQLGENSWRELLAINDHVNQTIYPVTDYDMFGQVEVWSYPQGGRGDCEDYVLLKRRMLIERGWPESALLITVVRQENGEGHAVLTVRTDRGDFILDNLVAPVRRWDETRYSFIKRQSEFDVGVWASISDTRAPVVGAIR